MPSSGSLSNHSVAKDVVAKRKKPVMKHSLSIKSCTVGVTEKKVVVVKTPDKLNQGRWTKSERLAFLRGLRKFGKSKWKEISTLVPTRDTTQTKTHAQTVMMRLSGGRNIFAELDLQEKKEKKERKNLKIGRARSKLGKLPLTAESTFTSPRTSKAARALIMLKESALQL